MLWLFKINKNKLDVDFVGTCCIYQSLTHWDRVTQLCIGNLTIIGSYNGLSTGRYQAIIWTNQLENCSNSHLYTTSVTEVIYAISCYIGPRYNDTWLYISHWWTASQWISQLVWHASFPQRKAGQVDVLLICCASGEKVDTFQTSIWYSLHLGIPNSYPILLEYMYLKPFNFIDT